MAKKSFGVALRNYFLAGVAVTAPAALTIFLIYFIVKTVDEYVARVMPDGWYDALYGHAAIPGLGVIIAVVFLISAGWLATNLLGRYFVRMWEYFIGRIPVIGTLYSTTKQVFETLAGANGHAFRQVVLVETSPGEWRIAFVTGAPEGEIKSRLPQGDYAQVFIPDAPSPMNGSFVFVQRSRIIPLDMTVEQGLKMVVSIGMIPPSGHKPVQKA